MSTIIFGKYVLIWIIKQSGLTYTISVIILGQASFLVKRCFERFINLSKLF